MKLCTGQEFLTLRKSLVVGARRAVPVLHISLMPPRAWHAMPLQMPLNAGQVAGQRLWREQRIFCRVQNRWSSFSSF